MKTVILSALLVGFVSAQSLAGLPTCAYSCVSNSIPASCNLSAKCICSASSFIQGVTCCVAQACDKADQEATLQYAKTICDPAGVTLTQTAAICASTASSNSSMSSTSMSGTSTGVLASGGVTSSVSSSAASVSSSLSSVVSSVSSSVSSAASAASSAAATSAGGAAQLMAKGGANVFAAIVAAAALL